MFNSSVLCPTCHFFFVFFFKQKTAYDMRISDWSSDVCSSDLLVFFNPSLRTRTSFELGAFQLGGHAVVLQPGKDAWPIEFDLGTVMDGEAEEHIAEVA